MLEIDLASCHKRRRSAKQSAGVIIKAHVHKQLIQLQNLWPRSLEHYQNFKLWLYVVLSHVRNACPCLTFLSPPLQAQDSTVTPPSMALAPAGPGAALVRWCRDPVQRCSTASDTTPPVSTHCWLLLPAKPKTID